MSRQRLKAVIAVLLLIAGIVPWFFRSDVARLIVLERHVLLGRYSVGWFCALCFLITPGCWIGAWVAWSLRTRTHRQVAFRLIAVSFAVLFGLVLVDGAARLLRKPTYVQTEGQALAQFPLDHQAGPVLHRLPNQVYRVDFRDEPKAARSYPGRPKGHPPVACTLTTDARGFRNAKALERCEIVTVGDSFVEGCFVSDDHPWPVKVAGKTGEKVYNLGMSGADPAGYLSALEAIGLSLKPRVVVVMIYEGNDYVPPLPTVEGGAWLRLKLASLARNSPVYRGLKSTLTSVLGPIGADAPVPEFETIGSWVPARIPPEAYGIPYSFWDKRITQLRANRTAFEAYPGWTRTAEILRRIHALCTRNGARLILTIAPNRDRVLLTLLDNRVEADALHAFVAIRGHPMPSPEVLRREVFENKDAREAVLRDFCRAEGIPYASTTDALASATREGRQVFYSYDQHWTPAGHELVADTLLPVINEALRAARPASPGRPPR